MIVMWQSAVRSVSICVRERPRTFGKPITARQLQNVRGRSRTKQLTELTADLGNTKESVLPVCDKPYHTNKIIVQKGGDIYMRNYALRLRILNYSSFVLISYQGKQHSWFIWFKTTRRGSVVLIGKSLTWFATGRQSFHYCS